MKGHSRYSARTRVIACGAWLAILALLGGAGEAADQDREKGAREAIVSVQGMQGPFCGRMPPFLDEMLTWTWASAVHVAAMFWWITLGAVAVTALSESVWAESPRRRLAARSDSGWRTVWLAVQLGVFSPPSRTRIFGQARELLAAGVSRAGVLAYLVTAQTILLWMLFLIVELNGPQPMLGQLVAVAAVLAILLAGARGMPDAWWEAARQRAGTPDGDLARGWRPPADPLWRRLAKSVGGQALSLWWPMLFGLLGIGFFLALGGWALDVGPSPDALSLQAWSGPLGELGNALAGLLLAYVIGAPMIGNALIAAGLWKAGFISYAGVSAFYLGTLVMPFALPRYFALFGEALARKILPWLAAGILVGSLTASGWWWGLDGLAGVAGVRAWFEQVTHSTLRPNDVPWFHHWFAPGI